MSRFKNPANALRCAWCRASWWNGAELDVVDGAIACSRGRGCARRPASHERMKRGPWGRMRREYLLDGHWYSTQQLADLAEMPLMNMHQRLRLGWCVRDAVTVPALRTHSGRSRKARVRKLLAFARAPVPLEIKTPSTRKPSPIVEAARACGISEASMRARVRRHGLEGALAMGSRSSPVTNAAGRPPVRGVSAARLAESAGLTRQGLYAAAKRTGLSLEEEVARRLAQRKAERRAA